MTPRARYRTLGYPLVLFELLAKPPHEIIHCYASGSLFFGRFEPDPE
jgi:hypothetical protein